MRISFGGGGTELSPYVDNFGGCVVSSSIGTFAYATIQINNFSKGFTFHSQDRKKSVHLEQYDEADLDTLDKDVLLPIACALHIKMKFNYTLPQGTEITIGSEAPIGSGLGASSVMTVAILEGLQQLAGLRWSKSILASEAYQVERNLLNLAGGLQDHFAAAFGGLNFIEFRKDKTAIIKPIEISPSKIAALESSLLLVYTGTSRDSSKIIETQRSSLERDEKNQIEIYHQIKKIAHHMLDAIESADLKEVGALLHESWELKKSTDQSVTSPAIDHLYELALDFGAYGGKISGAGGGGFMMLFCPPDSKIRIAASLNSEKTLIFPSSLTAHGAQFWK